MISDGSIILEMTSWKIYEFFFDHTFKVRSSSLAGARRHKIIKINSIDRKDTTRIGSFDEPLITGLFSLSLILERTYFQNRSLNWFQTPISLISLEKNAPESFCCIRTGQDHYAIKGEYGVHADPIEVLDSKTLRIPNFSFQGTKPPGNCVLKST